MDTRAHYCLAAGGWLAACLASCMRRACIIPQAAGCANAVQRAAVVLAVLLTMPLMIADRRIYI